MSLTLGLNTALSGLMTSQRGLDIISQNVVNVNTKGYTRKVMNAESRVLAGSGAGVQEGSVTRMVSQGLLKDIRRQATNTGKLEVEQDFYPRIDDLFGEVGDNTSIAHKINDLFSAFQTLGADVNKPATQWATMQSAQDVADLMGSMTTSLQSMRVEADRGVEQTVNQINTLLDNIQDLNQKIVKNAAIATGTSDLEDKRDTALSDLAKLVDIQYYERSDGAVTVYSTSGQMLLDNQPQHLSYSASSVTDTWMTLAGGQFSKITVAGGTTDFGPEITGGKLRGLLDMRDTTVPNLQANLDELASQMKTAMNQAHNRGTSLPNVASRYQGTRTFATQGDIQPTPVGPPANPDNAAVIYKGTAQVNPGAGGYGALTIAADATNKWQATFSSSLAAGTGPFTAAGFAPGTTFSIDNAEDPRNNGTYRVVKWTDTEHITVEKVNVRQTMQLQNSDDVVLATFDTLGNQLKQTTLNTIMQTDYSGSYTSATTGSGRSLMDFQSKASQGQWAINEVSAHIEGWLKSQGYNNASVNLDSDGKMVVDVGDSKISLAFRDQSSGTAGGTAADATISFDVNGDGSGDQTVKGFSNFLGLNDFYVNPSQNFLLDSVSKPATYATQSPFDLTLYDTTGQLGQKVSLKKGSSLQDIADAINAQTRTTDSVALNTNKWNLSSSATITVSDASGGLVTLNLGAGNHTLSEIAGKLTQGTVTASVVQDGGYTRLRLTDTRGVPLNVNISGGAITGSTLSLGETLDMNPVQRVQAAVVPDGSGYRLRIRQTEGGEIYAASSLGLIPELGLTQAASGTAGHMAVRSDIQTAPEKMSRGTMQWNSDTGRYYLSEGDNTTTMQMSQLMTSKTNFESTGSIASGKYSYAEYAAATISVVAQASSASKNSMDYQTTLNNSLDFQNASYSGVNLDEEISAMMDYQQAYSASAKVITVMQDMLETLTSMIR